VLIEYNAAKDQAYVAPAKSVKGLFEGVVFEDVQFADVKSLFEHLADPELEIYEEVMSVLLGSWMAMVATYILAVIVGSVVPELVLKAKSSKNKSMKLYLYAAGVAALSVGILLVSKAARKMVLGSQIA